jgi:uroporphyrinogen-III synthase
VTRLEAYRTCPAHWSPEQYTQAKSADIVAIASPSAAEVWVSRVGTDCVAVTIGPTSESAAHRLGFRRVVPCDNSISESTICNFAETIRLECKKI